MKIKTYLKFLIQIIITTTIIQYFRPHTRMSIIPDATPNRYLVKSPYSGCSATDTGHSLRLSPIITTTITTTIIIIIFPCFDNQADPLFSLCRSPQSHQTLLTIHYDRPSHCNEATYCAGIRSRFNTGGQHPLLLLF